MQPADLEQMTQHEAQDAPPEDDVPTIQIANDTPSADEVVITVPLASLLDTGTASTQPQAPTGTVRILIETRRRVLVRDAETQTVQVAAGGKESKRVSIYSFLVKMYIIT